MKNCEFCGKKRKTATTIFNGAYCIECYETVIEACEEAIKEIKAQEYNHDRARKRIEFESSKSVP